MADAANGKLEGAADNDAKPDSLSEKDNSSLPDDALTAPGPRDGLPAWRWMGILAVASLQSIVSGIDVGANASVQATVLRSFTAPDAPSNIAILHWLSLASATGSFALAPAATKLATACDLRVLLAAANVLVIVGAAVAGSAHEPDLRTVIGGRILNGVGAAATYQLPLAYVAAFAKLGELPAALALVAVSWAVGLVAGPAIGSSFAESDMATWRWAYYLNMPLAGVLIVCSLLILPSHTLTTTPSTSTPTRTAALHKLVPPSLASLDPLGCLLHTSVVTLFALGAGFSGSLWPSWSSGRVIAVWVVTALLAALLLAQQRLALLTSRSSRIWFPSPSPTTPTSLLQPLWPRAVPAQRTLLVLACLVLCAFSAAMAMEINYMPLLLAFAYGDSPKMAGPRSSVQPGVFVATFLLCGGLAWRSAHLAARRGTDKTPQPSSIWLLLVGHGVGAAFVLLGGAWLGTHDSTGTTQQHLMACEAILGIGSGAGLAMALATPYKLNRAAGSTSEPAAATRTLAFWRRHLLPTFVPLALGAAFLAVAVAGVVYQNFGFMLVKRAVAAAATTAPEIPALFVVVGGDPSDPRMAVDETPRGLLAGVLAPADLLFAPNPQGERLRARVLDALVEAVGRSFYMVAAWACLVIVAIVVAAGKLWKGARKVEAEGGVGGGGVLA